MTGDTIYANYISIIIKRDYFIKLYKAETPKKILKKKFLMSKFELVLGFVLHFYASCYCLALGRLVTYQIKLLLYIKITVKLTEKLL